MKTLALMTSGGDAPGMNAAIRAVTRAAVGSGFRVLGFQRGYDGILEEQYQELDARSVSNIVQRGGTILKTARSSEFLRTRGLVKAAAVLNKTGVDALVVIGGDGTFRGAMDLAGFWKGRIIGVPGTIDNDLAGTDFTIGFDTAVNTAVEAIDKIRDTAAAHERFFLVEVMGRRCGQIALEVGIAGGAEEILIPENPEDIRRIARRLCAGRDGGKSSSIIVVAEGVKGGALEAARQLKRLTRNEYRVAILGYIQRGGNPTAADRCLATRLGVRAVEALLQGETGKMAGEVGGRGVLAPFHVAVKGKRQVDRLYPRLMKFLNL
ncbi:MAG: 6-phosphofructokinase [Verrucomicrobia bacterium]|nr:6-phosphofructokinase [Verrucomicrobiota bacterium]MDE3097861.1 6-phosphofructokinase [Verrucomicrobiota bacterium]